MVEDLLAQVSIDSRTGNERPYADWLLARYADLGLQVAAHDLDDGRRNVLAWAGEGEDALVFSGHLDTVEPEEDLWTRSPWDAHVTEDGERIVGLGASDLKASIVCATQATLAWKNAGRPGRVMMAWTFEEETTGDGTAALVPWAVGQGIWDPARTSVIVTEPTGLDHLSIGNRGSVFYEVHVTGEGGHGSRPHLARNPIPKALAILADVPRLSGELAAEHDDPDLGPSTLTPTALLAGDLERTNSIPGRVSFVVDCRPTPPLDADDLALFRTAFEGMLAGHAEDGFEIEFTPQFAREGHKIAADHPLVGHTVAALADTGIAAEVRTTPAGNDAVYFGMAGIPAVNKLGPGDPGQAHKVDEHCPVGALAVGCEAFLRIADHVLAE